MTLAQYLDDHGVTAQAQTSADSGPIRIAIQQPPGWLAYDAFQLPNTYVVLTDRQAIDQNFAPNAVVMVHKLTGEFVVPPRSWRVSYAACGLVLDSLIS